MNNVFGLVLAGGVGTRMGNIEKPKQFLHVGSKPIIIHTLEKFVIQNEFEEIIVLTPKQWINFTKDVIKKYIPVAEKIVVLEGGSSRNETIMNAISYIEKQDKLNEDTIIVTHDSVRPFVTSRIIKENIEAAIKYGACDTVIPATDTIVESENGESISAVPDRSRLFQGQTPQTFHAKKLRDYYESLSDDEKEILTDACKIMVIKGETVKLVKGDVSNLKITYPYDLKVAESLLQ
ncbi:MAG: 2-C-methyl-D-erythritol 4-phosphate cytidylyltransferase [Lachnospiraceae bacterium]|nr:2-C-methyl-D-erythritol 4-phosphate cytidylyltransferase [Lachnospiraceae bacterium]